MGSRSKGKWRSKSGEKRKGQPYKDWPISDVFKPPPPPKKKKFRKGKKP